MKSMTGYALTEKHIKDASVSLEIKSYNSRYLELNLNLPFWLSGLEPVFKSFFSSRIARGKVEVCLRVKDLNLDINIITNTSIAKAYAKALREIAEAACISSEIDINAFSEKEGVLTVERNIDLHSWEELLLPVFEETFQNYELTKIAEGEILKKDITANMERILSAIKIIKKYAPQMEELFCQTIKDRFKELIGNEINEQRIMQEVAVMLVKYTINEEIVRLEAHCNTLSNELKQKCPIGKKLDFICQEINREINTIGSKNQMLEMSQSIIEVKDALENIREQSRNVE
ncbi:YicC/YloC family endoribonuclease [Treponema pedis]|uniref:YicC/YloC family endoribonuclease n=1 Tax=Treponema pedis TaxID=409322 RepID=UPI00197E61A2|nr:YicC/YloC family endoribonuclease [Treponema pedis]QSI04855.1 YicC family protein [Treponema pedis]